MTDDEQAEEVLDLLCRIKRCPDCRRPMRERAPFDEAGWMCLNNNCQVHSMHPDGTIYRYLRDGITATSDFSSAK